MSLKETTYLSDYKPYPFKIPNINLEIIIYETKVLVLSSMVIEPDTYEAKPLILKGKGIKIISLRLDEKPIKEDMYSLTDEQLIISETITNRAILNVESEINPYNNTSLEGLYLSGEILSTQCEAEGFRRITYHPDRPDVLSRYKVRIEADIEKYPVLLSNGNKINSGPVKNSQNRHQVIWEDQFPKPSYLFALVAGSLEYYQDFYYTFSGKKVQLRIYVEAGDKSYTKHAIDSLKKAMRWDEDVYGFEYDLDEYNIVAVRHFNMGAMENKSLNIFNSKLVLADINTATDVELERIESVIAHEYFHNWTGNRITCRDWFQLSLKEGLTVFRDQSFTSDSHSASVKRIDDVSLLRNTQFLEDSGPTSHAVKPIKYKSIDNFYTTTIYEKGAELVRMLYSLLGHNRFMIGMEEYVKRFDGCAATTEDFVEAITYGASIDNKPLGFNLNKFIRWYYQAGTPSIQIERIWDKDNGSYRIFFKQIFGINSDNINIQPLVIPIRIATVNSEGTVGEEQLLVLDEEEKEFILQTDHVGSEPPALSIFRNFSSPVKWEIDQTQEELFALFELDNDLFSRWEAGQNILRSILLARASDVPQLKKEDHLIKIFEKLLASFKEEQACEVATLLRMPGLAELESAQKISDPIAIYNALYTFKAFLGQKLSSSLFELLDKTRLAWEALWPTGRGERELTGIAWSWLVVSGNREILDEVLKAVSASSMTLSKFALRALQPIECQERETALQEFYDRWEDRPVILDSWFAFQASTPWNDSLSRIEDLMCHPRFDPMAPNAIRAVLGGLVHNIPAFHSLDGSGYEFMGDKLLDVDKRNPITASRMVKCFSQWRSYDNQRSGKMLKVIQRLSQSNLSSNTREVVELMQR